MNRLATIRTQAAKLRKNKCKYDKLKEATLQAKKEFFKRQGAYHKGVNLDYPFGELCNGKDNDRKPPAKQAKVNKSNPSFCGYCGGNNHLTKHSKKCLAPLQTEKQFAKDGTLLSLAPTGACDADAAIAALQDCDAMDSMPFHVEYNSDDDDSGPQPFMIDAWNGDNEAEESQNDEVRIIGGTI